MSDAEAVDPPDDPVPSPRMGVDDLAVAVERAAAGMSHSALSRATGLSARTLRELLAGGTTRQFYRVTLDKLDGPLGWAPGTAWRLYRAGGEAPAPDAADPVKAMLDALEARLERIEEQPSWATELIDAVRLLSPEARAIVLSLIHLLGAPAPGS